MTATSFGRSGNSEALYIRDLGDQGVDRFVDATPTLVPDLDPSAEAAPPAAALPGAPSGGSKYQKTPSLAASRLMKAKSLKDQRWLVVQFSVHARDEAASSTTVRVGSGIGRRLSQIRPARFRKRRRRHGNRARRLR